ncbi:hypothetical protein Tco_0359289 [Tanacetum coccineum]
MKGEASRAVREKRNESQGRREERSIYWDGIPIWLVKVSGYGTAGWVRCLDAMYYGRRVLCGVRRGWEGWLLGVRGESERALLMSRSPEREKWQERRESERAERGESGASRDRASSREHIDIALCMAGQYEVLYMSVRGTVHVILGVCQSKVRVWGSEANHWRSEGNFVEVANTRSSEPNYHNTLRSSNIIGLSPERTKMPLPLEDGVRCQRCTCKCCGYNLKEGFCLFCASRDENSSIDAPNPNSFNDLPNVFTHPPQPQYETYSCELCGNDSHYGYDCPPRVPLVYEQEPCYNQNFGNNYPQNSPSFPQQYLCCVNCGGPHGSFQCQPMNQNHFKHNSNYSGFDQPPQYSIDHQEDLNQQKISDVHDRWDKIDESQNELLNMMQSFCEMVIQQKQAANIDQSPPQEMSIQDMEDLKQQYLDEMQSISNQIQIKDYRNEKIDIRYRRECEIMIDELTGKFNGMSIEINKKKELRQLEQAANLSTYTTEPPRRFNYFYDDDDYEESTIPLNEIVSQIPPSIAITPVLPTMEPEDSLIMGDENLSTIPEKESDEFIKSSVEDLVPIPSESEDTSDSDKECDLPFCDNSVTFPLTDDESLSDEDVLKDNVKIYSNPLFEFDDEYISSDVNPLFDEVLENIESKDSYVSNLDEPALLVTPLSKLNEDECFDPGCDVDEIELLLHHDPSTPKISVASILEGFTDEPPLEENDDLFDLESKENEWKKILYDAPIDDLMTEDKVFDPGIWEIIFSPTYVKLPFEDRHYLSLTYVIRIFLPYFTYPVESPFLLSSGSEDTIFDPGIPVFSLEPVVSHQSGTFMCFNVYLNILNESPIEIFSSTCFVPNITMIWGESS